MQKQKELRVQDKVVLGIFIGSLLGFLFFGEQLRDMSKPPLPKETYQSVPILAKVSGPF